MGNEINKNRCGNIIWFNPPFCKLSNIKYREIFSRFNKQTF